MMRTSRILLCYQSKIDHSMLSQMDINYQTMPSAKLLVAIFAFVGDLVIFSRMISHKDLPWLAGKIAVN